MTSSSLSFSSLINQLKSEQALTQQDQTTLENLLKSDPEQAEMSALFKNQATTSDSPPSLAQTPWYINVLIGFSAWLSSLFMIAFLFAAKILNFREDITFLVTGLVFLVGGLALYISFKKIESVFFNQMALALTMTGRILSVIGFAILLKNPTKTALCTIVMELVVLVLYTEKLQRFLSTLIIHGAVLFLGTHLKNSSLLYAYIGALALFLYVLWVYEPPILSSLLHEMIVPVGYGSAVALLGSMAFSTTPFMTKIFFVPLWWPVTAVMGVVWLLTGLSIAYVYRVSLLSPLALLLGITLIAFCGFVYEAPGVTAAGLILTIAYYRDEKLLAGLAILALIVFVFFYYYGLRINLLDKSIALFVPGVIVLVARGILIKMAQPSPTAA